MKKFRTRLITREDFPFAIQLTETMNWDLTDKDFEFMMWLEPKGCFVAFDGTEKCGLITTVHFGRVGWIGNVIVEQRYRFKGVGSLLLKKALDYLLSKSVKTIRLYSYLDTVPFYERLGFRADSSFIRFVGQASQQVLKSELAKKMVKSDLQDVENLDKVCFGGSRKRLLRRLFASSEDLCYVGREDQRLMSFIMADWYRQEIGPWICHPDYHEDISNLLGYVVNKLAGLEVRIGVSEKAQKIVGLLRDMDFKEEFKVVRMYYGERLREDNCLLAMESLERG